MKKLAGVLRPVDGGRRDDHPIVERCRTTERGERAMGRMDDVSAIAMIGSGETGVDGAARLDGTALGLPDALTWSATLDPHDDTREIEITEEMVELALDEIERSQVYPFRREAGTPPPVARPVRKADVIVFPKVG